MTNDAALKACQSALGSEGVLITCAQALEFRDPFASPGREWYEPGAVLMPGKQGIWPKGMRK